MARARTTPEAEDDVVAKPRLRRPRKVATDDIEDAVLASPSPRRRRPVQPTIDSPEVQSARKAPTPLRAHRTHQVQSIKTFMGVASVCVVIALSGVMVGFLDSGPIDVVAVVNERNEKINRGEVRDEKTGEALTQTISVQNTDTRPNGGLQVADPSAVPPPPSTVVTEVATTTDATASSTDTIDPDAEAAAPAETAVPDTAPELPAA